MAFDEILFPLGISQGSAGGPGFKTNLVASDSGSEVRTQRWTQSRIAYNASLGVRNITDIAALIAFFRARGGKARGFRFRDYTDYTSAADNVSTPNSSDQVIAIGNASNTAFNLIKNYTNGLISHTRRILKPVSGSVVAALDGVRCTMVNAFSDPLPYVFVSRASIGTYLDSTGTLQTANTNVARYGYTWNNTTHTWNSSGLVVEPAANNQIIDNTFANVVTGNYPSPGTISASWSIDVPTGLGVQIVGSGQESGIDYVDIRFTLAPDANGGLTIRMNTTDINTIAGDTWTLSSFIRLITPADFNLYGTTMMHLVIVGLDSTRAPVQNVYSDDINNAVFTNCHQDFLNSTTYNTLNHLRYQVSGVTANTADLTYIQPQLFIGFSNSLANDFTLRIGLPQLEKNVPLTTATMPIKTAGSIGTRAADVYTIAGGGSAVKCLADYSAGTISFESAPANDVIVSAGYLFDIPVRFDTDALTISLAHVKSGSCDVPLIEVRV